MKLVIKETYAYKYPNQCIAQSRFYEIKSSGLVEVRVNPEIGNAIPASVYNGLILRIHISSCMRRKDIKNFYIENRKDFACVLDGMGEKWDGNNTVGTLSDDARDALERLEFGMMGIYGS